MTPALLTGIVFLILALCMFAGIINQLTSKYFNEEDIRIEIFCASATWGFAVVALVVHFLSTLF